MIIFNPMNVREGKFLRNQMRQGRAGLHKHDNKYFHGGLFKHFFRKFKKTKL